MLKSFGGAHGQLEGAVLQPRWECTFTAVSSQTHLKNVPVRPPWPDLQCIVVPPAAAAAAKGLEGHAGETGRLPGPPWAAGGEPFFASRAWRAARHSPCLNLHALARFATAPGSPSDRAIS